MEDYRYEEKEDHAGRKVKVLGATFEEGKPEERESAASQKRKKPSPEEAIEQGPSGNEGAIKLHS